MFADGNFNAPMLIHSTNVPGTAVMSKLKDQLHWTLTETPRGDGSQLPQTTNQRWMRFTSF
jgi:hypothetical protein